MGYTPFFLMFGREARLPLDLLYHVDMPEPTIRSEYATIQSGENKVWPETADTKTVL